jgi:hypothetical protein
MNGMPAFFAFGELHDPIVPARFGGRLLGVVDFALLR